MYVTPEYVAPKSIAMDTLLPLNNALFPSVSGLDFVMLRLEKGVGGPYVSSTTLFAWGNNCKEILEILLLGALLVCTRWGI